MTNVSSTGKGLSSFSSDKNVVKIFVVSVEPLGGLEGLILTLMLMLKMVTLVVLTGMLGLVSLAGPVGLVKLTTLFRLPHCYNCADKMGTHKYRAFPT